MINPSDPLDRLRAANPVPAGVAMLSRPDPVLFERIVAGRAPGQVPLPPRRLRAGRLVPALVVASLLGGGAVAYAVLRGDVSKPHTVACYEGADLEARAEVARVDARGPVAACADFWQRGVLGPGGEVPALTECVLDSGVAGVFPAPPGQEVCVRLNIGPVPSTAPPPTSSPATGPPATQADVNARFLAFRDAVLPQFLAVKCMEPRAGAAIVRRELAVAGLEDWSVTGGEGTAAEGYTPQRPCASLALQPERRLVILVPVPPLP